MEQIISYKGKKFQAKTLPIRAEGKPVIVAEKNLDRTVFDYKKMFYKDEQAQAIDETIFAYLPTKVLNLPDLELSCYILSLYFRHSRKLNFCREKQDQNKELTRLLNTVKDNFEVIKSIELQNEKMLLQLFDAIADSAQLIGVNSDSVTRIFLSHEKREQIKAKLAFLRAVRNNQKSIPVPQISYPQSCN
jgi:hypothetical protein